MWRSTSRSSDCDGFAGKPAFGGDTSAETLTAVITREPDWGALPARTPPPLVKLVRWCLDKDRKHRLAHIADARAELREALRGRESGEVVPASTRRLDVLQWIIAALALTALAASDLCSYSAAGADSSSLRRTCSTKHGPGSENRAVSRW